MDGYIDGSLVPTDDLIRLFDWELIPSEQALAESTLITLSQEAIELGRDWCSPDEAKAEGETRPGVPKLVQMKILHAARRYMVNDMGLTTSRSGEENLAWDGVGDKAGSPYFTDEEKKLIAKIAGRSSNFKSVDSHAWSSRPAHLADGFVPVSSGGAPFPLYAAGGW